MRFSTSGNLLDGYRNGTKHHHCIVFNASHCPEKLIELAAYNELQQRVAAGFADPRSRCYTNTI